MGDDGLGINEALNETDKDGDGYRIYSKYYLQIFDHIKGKSLQREQQIEIQ